MRTQMKEAECEEYRATHLVRMWKPFTDGLKTYVFREEEHARKAYGVACELWPDWTVQLKEFDGNQLEYREASK